MRLACSLPVARHVQLRFPNVLITRPKTTQKYRRSHLVKKNPSLRPEERNYRKSEIQRSCVKRSRTEIAPNDEKRNRLYQPTSNKTQIRAKKTHDVTIYSARKQKHNKTEKNHFFRFSFLFFRILTELISFDFFSISAFVSCNSAALFSFNSL